MADNTASTTTVFTGQEYDLDLYLKEVELEKRMTFLGSERYQSKVARLKEAANEHRSNYGQQLLKRSIARVTDGVSEFVTNAMQKAGRRHTSVKYLVQLEPETLAYLGLRGVLSGVSVRKTLLSVMLEIGRLVEDECQFRQIREADRRLFDRCMEQSRKRIDYRHKSYVIRHVARTAGIEWQAWPKEDRAKIGEKLIDIIIQKTGLVKIEYPYRTGKRTQPHYLVPDESTREWIEHKQDVDRLLEPVYAPMIVEPVDWQSTEHGGYLSKYVRPLRFIKAPAEVRKRIDACEMPVVYAAVNAMQRTAWRVNTQVLDVLNTAYTSGAAWTKIPVGKLLEIPPKPHDIATNDDARKSWKRQASHIHNTNARSKSARAMLNAVRNMANQYRQYARIYLPYTLDFRGRIYAVPVLNPQGADHTKALLQFADGMPLGEDGFEWLCIHGANLAGVDKVPFQERVEFIGKHTDEILAIAADPFSTRTWISGFARGCRHEKQKNNGLEIDKPWQFLAFCFEYANIIRAAQQGSALRDCISALPVALDGSCSGMQHYSLALHDEVGGAAVNIVPSDTPADIYTLVAQEVEALVRRDISTNADIAQIAQQWVNVGITRKVCKRPVMTFPYGSGMYGYRQQLMDDFMSPLREKTGETDFPFNADGFQAAHYLAVNIQQALPKVVTKAAQGMHYLRGVARIATRADCALEWITPNGLLVVQKNCKDSTHVIRTMIAGTMHDITLRKPTTKIDSNAQANAVAPNFIHSLDAAHLQLTVARSHEEFGIRALALVHDSFGTHAGNTTLLFNIIRDSLIRLYSQHDVFQDFRTGVYQCLPEKQRAELNEWDASALPRKGNLDIKQVIDATYAFA